MESKKKKNKTVLMNLVAGQEKRGRHRKWTGGHGVGGRSWGEVSVALTYIHYRM